MVKRTVCARDCYDTCSLGDIKSAMTMIGYGLQKRSGGADQVRAVSFIPALLGLKWGFFYGNSGAYYIDTAHLKGARLSAARSKIVNQVALADEDWLFENHLDVLRQVLKGAFESGDFDALLRGRRLKLRCRPQDAYPTPSGKIEFWSTVAKRDN